MVGVEFTLLYKGKVMVEKIPRTDLWKNIVFTDLHCFDCRSGEKAVFFYQKIDNSCRVVMKLK